MKLQVADQLPRPTKDPEGLADIGKWMSAADLVHLIHTAEQQSQAQMQQQGVTVQIMLDTMHMSGRVQLLLAAVNLHRILRALEGYLAQEVLPVDQLQVRPDEPNGYV